jgi:hypothetical protein
MKEKQVVQDLFYFIGVGIKEYEEKKPFFKTVKTSKNVFFVFQTEK